MFPRILMWMLAGLLALSGPGIPVVWAQLEITPEVREACGNFEPGLREIALNEIVPAIEAEPEGSEARVVETTAVAIHEAAVTTPIELDNPEAVETALKAHFEGVLRASMEGGVGVPPPEVMEKMMGQMAACGIDPGDVFRGVGEIPEPPQAVLDAMTPDQRVGYEAWKSGDFATLEKMHMEAAMKAGHEAMEKYGMSPEMIAKETAHMKDMEAIYREMMEKGTMDPRAETSATAETTFATQGVAGSTAPTPSPGTTEVLVASHDHLPPPVGDGINDEYHYDTNGDGIADHAHSVPH